MSISDTFLDIYWDQYIMLEREFYNTLHYVSLSEDNYNTYSSAFIKIILQIGSEVDIALKYYCKLLNDSFDGDKIYKYQQFLQKKDPDFCAQKIQCLYSYIVLEPWIKWRISSEQPCWWTVYNKIKHCRDQLGTIENETKKYYKFANLKYTLQGLSALYQTLIYSYYRHAKDEDKTIITPLPGSRMFKLVGDGWDNIDFYADEGFYIENDHLIMEFRKSYY